MPYQAHMYQDLSTGELHLDTGQLGIILINCLLLWVVIIIMPSNLSLKLTIFLLASAFMMQLALEFNEQHFKTNIKGNTSMKELVVMSDREGMAQEQNAYLEHMGQGSISNIF